VVLGFAFQELSAKENQHQSTDMFYPTLVFQEKRGVYEIASSKNVR
jgi:hypothetical protein